MKKILLTLLLGALATGASADVQTQEFQWSYCSQNLDIGAFGTSQPENYSVAMIFNQPNYAGMKITKIDAYINADQSTLANISNTSVFLAGSLTDNDNANLRYSAVTPQVTKLQGEDIAVLHYELEEPYVIGSAAVFAGYNLTVDQIPVTNNAGQRYPILVDKNLYQEGTCYIRTPYLTENAWDINGYTYGAAVIYLTIEREVVDWGLGAGFLDVQYAEVGKSSDVLLAVTNNGLNPITSISYEYRLDGGEPVSRNVTLQQPLAPGVDARYGVLLPIDAVAEPGEYEISLTLTELNGHPNEAGDGCTAVGELDVFSYMPQHRPLVEEYTALACGYCPRGYVAMEYLSEEYPDDAVVLCYHLEFAGNKDPMTVTGFPPVSATNYPTASIDRVKVIDPYYGDYEVHGEIDLGIVDDMFSRAKQVAIADINIGSVEVSMPDSVINVKADVTFMKGVENDRYRIGYVLSCDGLYSNTWKQTNYFSRDQNFKDTPLIQQFYALPGSVYGLTFNDVVINAQGMRGIANSVVDVTPYESFTHEYSFDVKDVQNIYRDSLNPYVKIHRMWVNAFIVDRTNGTIVNACKFPVRSVYDAVEGIAADEEAVATVYYDLQGRKVENPDRGIFVKKSTMSDGTVRTAKVVM